MEYKEKLRLHKSIHYHEGCIEYYKKLLLNPNADVETINKQIEMQENKIADLYDKLKPTT